MRRGGGKSFPKACGLRRSSGSPPGSLGTALPSPWERPPKRRNTSHAPIPTATPWNSPRAAAGIAATEVAGPDFAAGHSQHRERGPVGTASVASLGAVISTTLRHKLKIAYLCNGQRVPEDLHSAHQRRVWLVRAAHKLMQHAPLKRDDAYYARNFGRAQIHA